jgi:hypothetical protein
MRVGIFAGHRPMGRPAGMADACMTGNRVSFDLINQIGNPAHRFSHFDAIILENSYPSRIIAAVFKTTKTVQENRQGIGGSDISNNSTHKTNVTTERLRRKL